MVLQEDMPFDLVAEIGGCLELALGDRRFKRFTAAFVFQHFLAIEPVFDMIAADHNP